MGATVLLCGIKKEVISNVHIPYDYPGGSRCLQPYVVVVECIVVDVERGTVAGCGSVFI